MKTTNILWASVTITMVLLAPSASAAMGLGAGFSGASVHDALRNDADIEQGSSGIYALEGRGSSGEISAAASCQMAFLFNTIITNIAAAEGLGLAEDNDELLARTLQTEPETTVTWDNTTATASCEQSIGAVLVSLEALDGWGEPAPQEDDATAALFQNGIGGGSGIGLGLSGGTIENVLENDVAIYQGSSGGGSGTHAASACQLLVTWNTLLVNAALARGEGEGQDNDATPTPITASNGKSYENGGGHEAENEMKAASSSCAQSVDSITLIVGDTPTLPPES